jgi:hypothetical protein
VNGTDGLNFAAVEPITAVDKNGKQVNSTKEFEVSKYLQINTVLWGCGLTVRAQCICVIIHLSN